MNDKAILTQELYWINKTTERIEWYQTVFHRIQYKLFCNEKRRDVLEDIGVTLGCHREFTYLYLTASTSSFQMRPTLTR